MNHEFPLSQSFDPAGGVDAPVYRLQTMLESLSGAARDSAAPLYQKFRLAPHLAYLHDTLAAKTGMQFNRQEFMSGMSIDQKAEDLKMTAVSARVERDLPELLKMGEGALTAYMESVRAILKSRPDSPQIAELARPNKDQMGFAIALAMLNPNASGAILQGMLGGQIAERDRQQEFNNIEFETQLQEIDAELGLAGAEFQGKTNLLNQEIGLLTRQEDIKRETDWRERVFKREGEQYNEQTGLRRSEFAARLGLDERQMKLAEDNFAWVKRPEFAKAADDYDAMMATGKFTEEEATAAAFSKFIVGAAQAKWLPQTMEQTFNMNKMEFERKQELYKLISPTKEAEQELWRMDFERRQGEKNLRLMDAQIQNYRRAGATPDDTLLKEYLGAIVNSINQDQALIKDLKGRRASASGTSVGTTQNVAGKAVTVYSPRDLSEIDREISDAETRIQENKRKGAEVRPTMFPDYKPTYSNGIKIG